MEAARCGLGKCNWFTDGGAGVSSREKMVLITSIIFAECYDLVIYDRLHNAGLCWQLFAII